MSLDSTLYCMYYMLYVSRAQLRILELAAAITGVLGNGFAWASRPRHISVDKKSKPACALDNLQMYYVCLSIDRHQAFSKKDG
jgi:hypothetical protein